MRRGNEMRCWSRGGLASTAAVTAILAVGFTATQALGADSGKPITIGYSTYTVANPAFAGIIQGMKAEAEKFGYKFLIANSNNSATQQIADVDSLIT
jgi:ABC-type sugar transport system substrate-binding protein